MSDSNWRERTWTKIKETSGVECRPHGYADLWVMPTSVG
jgi:hypothetical protein